MSVPSVYHSLFNRNGNAGGLPSGERDRAAIVSPSYSGQGRNGESASQRERPGEDQAVQDDLLDRAWGSGLFSIYDIQAWFAARAVDFRDGLTELLRRKAIDIKPEMIFQLNGFGNVVMGNSHPDRDNIEAVINSHRGLRRLFISLAATARFLRTVEEHIVIRELYARDPDAAMISYQQLQDDSPRDPFLMRMTAEGFTTFFVSVPDPTQLAPAR